MTASLHTDTARTIRANFDYDAAYDAARDQIAFTLAGRTVGKSAVARAILKRAYVTAGQEYLVEQARSVVRQLEKVGQ